MGDGVLSFLLTSGVCNTTQMSWEHNVSLFEIFFGKQLIFQACDVKCITLKKCPKHVRKLSF
jgi:hypothetical protein